MPPDAKTLAMTVFSYHLAKTPIAMSVGALLWPPKKESVAGLRHIECMNVMTLGSPILSTLRMQLTNLAVFARWDSEAAIDDFMATPLGEQLQTGWHVRMKFLRRWGKISAFNDLPHEPERITPSTPVVAVTLARLKLLQAFRFIRWGKPVEEFVRDHRGVTLALASVRPLRTISTFTVWRSLEEMLDMVNRKTERHHVAMQERNRKGFHHEFMTLRFRAISEHGVWNGRSDIVPT